MIVYLVLFASFFTNVSCSFALTMYVRTFAFLFGRLLYPDALLYMETGGEHATSRRPVGRRADTNNALLYRGGVGMRERLYVRRFFMPILDLCSYYRSASLFECVRTPTSTQGKVGTWGYVTFRLHLLSTLSPNKLAAGVRTYVCTRVVSEKWGD